MKANSLIRFLAAQTQVAFNDNAAKLILIGVAQLVLPPGPAAVVTAILALLLVAPFVLFAPVGGWLADRFPKKEVMFASLVAQLLIMVILCVSVLTRRMELLLAGFLLLGTQSALMSPSKRGLVGELSGPSRVGMAVGWMEMLVVAAILAGSFLGGNLIDGLNLRLNDPWIAAGWAFTLLLVGCFVSLALIRRVPSRRPRNPQPWNAGRLTAHFKELRQLTSRPPLFRAALGESFFYFLGGVLVLTLAGLGRELYPDGPGAARTTGLMLALSGVGVMTGSLFAAYLNRNEIRLGVIPFGAAGLGLSLLGLARTPAASAEFYLLLVGVGLSGALMLVPLSAYLVWRSPEASRGSILASANLLSSLAGMIAVGVQMKLSALLGVDAQGQFFALGIMAFGVAIVSLGWLPKEVLRLLLRMLFGARYGLRVQGLDKIPQEGGALMVCNHVSYIDAILLSLASPRPLRFLSHESFFKMPVLGSVLRGLGVIPVSSHGARSALTRAVERIQAGEVVCIFPEGELTRTGCLMQLRPGWQWIARQSGAPVVAAWMDGLWGSIYSFSDGAYFFKMPKGLRRRIHVSFARLPEDADDAGLRQLLLDMGARAFSARSEWKQGLAVRAVASLRRRPWRVQLEDFSGLKPVRFRAGTLLALSLVLARRWRQAFTEQRVGVILPPGLGGTAANLALTLAGKTPVNLNPTAGLEAARHALDQAGVQRIVTADRVVERFGSYPWTEDRIDLRLEIEVVGRLKLLLALLSVWTLPGWLLRNVWRVSRQGGGEEATLLFTSGSSALPKGVPLTHANLVGNLTQVNETGVLEKKDSILSPLPLFHSFGLTIGMWYPLLNGLRAIHSPSPLELKSLESALRDGKPTILAGTPTFLDRYARRFKPESFQSLRMVIAGAERLPPSLSERFETQLGVPLFEGYGLTEASPVVSLNRPHPRRSMGALSMQTGWEPGSVGRLLPGISFRLKPVEGMEDAGELCLKGINLLRTYLDPSQNQGRLEDGWYQTGDLVRMDRDGYLLIKGRTSRFSKLGGEMVSHAAVEQALAKALPCEASEAGPADCVMGVREEGKGEELVLLTTRAVEPEEIRRALHRSGIPNLWIPRRVVRMESLPQLASGKLDLGECQRVAGDASSKLEKEVVR